MSIVIDERIQKYIEGFSHGKNNEIISIYMKDIDETFWFDSNIVAQNFLNKQVIERVGDLELRKDLFYYTDPNGEIHKYMITVNNKGKIISYIEEVVDEEDIKFWDEEDEFLSLVR